MLKAIFSVLIYFFITSNASGQEKDDSFFLIPFGYNFMRIGEQTIHQPAAGAGFMNGERSPPFNEINRRILAFALYQPLIFKTNPYPDVPVHLHKIEALIDGQINRHQLLFAFKSSSDKPVAGGLSTFKAGFGWGYELVRRPQVSLILGAALGVSDFGLSLPSGAVWPLFPLPLLRFNVNSEWFSSSFYFLTGPNLSFTVAPKEKFRFTADMRMENYHSISDLIYEYIVWYRLFGTDHRLGDFAGIGFGIKNDAMDFFISQSSATFELQQSSVIAVIDLFLFKIESGWIYKSRYMIDGKKDAGTGNGFFISVQGILPIRKK